MDLRFEYLPRNVLCINFFINFAVLMKESHETMKRFLIMLALVLTTCRLAQAQDPNNYPPDDTTVEIDSTNLPIVWIDVDGATITRTDRISARMKIIHNGKGRLNYGDTVAHPGQHVDYEGYIALRYRGNSSYSMSDKKPYSFRTLSQPLDSGYDKKKVPILGMGKDNDWALIAPYADKSMIRDLLGFEIARPWMEYTPQGRLCEVYLDGTYYGVYILSEVVSKGKHRLNLDDPGDEGDALTGGYLMEVARYDDMYYLSKYHPVNTAGTPYNDRYILFQYKSPDYEDLTWTQREYIHGAIDRMEDAFASENFTNPEESYRKYIDVQSFMDYQLMQELSHNVDAYRLSGKFFKRRDSIDPRFKMVVWDLNLAFGNARHNQGYYTNTWVYWLNPVLYSNNDYMIPFWWYKLNTDPEYTAALKARWAEYRRSNLRQERILATVDSLATVLTSHGAVERNSDAWPRWGQYVWPNYYIADNYAEEVDWLKQWLVERIAWMDEQLGFDPNAHLRGDVNGDGDVNVTDVTLLIAYLLTEGATGIDVDAADCSLDGSWNINDVTMLINYILTEQWPD